MAWYQQQGVSPAIATEYDVIAHRKYRGFIYPPNWTKYHPRREGDAYFALGVALHPRDHVIGVSSHFLIHASYRGSSSAPTTSSATTKKPSPVALPYL